MNLMMTQPSSNLHCKLSYGTSGSNYQMESANLMRPPPGQPQLLQTPRRKRPCIPMLSPLMPSTESNVASSSCPMEVPNASQEPTQKVGYEAWTEGAKAHLFQWLELPGNYNKWKCAGAKGSNGSKKTSGLTKKVVTKVIFEYLDAVQTKKTPEQVMSKMRYVEKKFKEAKDYLQNTGEGLTTVDKKMGITQIREKVLFICPFYYQVKPFMSDSVAVNPPYIGETGTDENIDDMLFGTNTGQGLYESIAEDGDDLNSQDKNSSADEEPDFEEEMSAQQEPITEVAPEGIPPVPEATQSTITPNRKPKEKKKKPKSFQESIQDMQEQNRVLMEKKLDLHSENLHQKRLVENQKLVIEEQRLQLQREELQAKHAMDSCRLDLEFMRMDQQRDESRIRELALQVKLEKLRGTFVGSI